jgi:putative transcriptional regulator
MGKKALWFPGLDEGERVPARSERKNGNRAREENLDLTFGVGAQIAEMRKRQDMTQQQLAEKIEVARSTIANIEIGYQNLSVLHLYRIAEALDCEVQIDLRRL